MSEAIRRIDPEELRTHVARLRALARRLLAGGEADDVVQDALVAAIERPPRTGAAMGPWLVGVVRNLVRRQYRSASRRTTHESAAGSRDRTPTPDQIAARSEALRDLADAVHRLESIYREVVVLHFFDGLRTSEIAAQLDVPVETVRTRLKRALAQLRDHLDAEHGGDGRTWCAVLAPLVTRHAALELPMLLRGGFAMTAKSKASMGVAALLLICLTLSVVVLGSRDRPPPVTTVAVEPAREPAVLVEDRSAPPPEPAGPATPAPTPRPPVVVAAPPAPAPMAPEPAAEELPAAEPVGMAIVSGAVWFAGTRKPAAEQQVVVEARGAAPIAATSDALGRFRFERLLEGRAWRLRIEAPGFAPVVVPNLNLEREERRDLGVLWLDAPVPLGVVVKDWSDRPIAGATVDARPYVLVGVSDGWDHAFSFRHVREPVALATTGADGKATLATLPPGDWEISAQADGFAPARQFRVPLPRGATRREVTIRLCRGLGLEGRLLDADRRGVSGLTVWASPLKMRFVTSLPQRGATDAAGRFAFDALVPGDWEIRAGRAGSIPSVVALVRVPSAAPVEIVLDGGIVEGKVTSASDGKPLAGARISVWTVSDRGIWIAEAMTGEDGRYRLDTIRAGRPEFYRVERQGFATLDLTTPSLMSSAEVSAHCGPVTRDFALQPGAPLAGRVTSPDGPVPGARVVANWVDRSPSNAWTLRTEGVTDGDGRFALAGVPATTVVVQVFADGWFQKGLADFNWSTALLRGRKVAGSIEVPPAGRTDLAISMSRACVVAGCVESSSGAPVAGAWVSCGWSQTTTGDDGTFRLDVAVTGGASEVSAYLDSGAWTKQPVALTEGGRIDGVVLRLPRTVRIGGHVRDAAGAAVDGASAEVVVRLAQPQYGQREWTVARVPVDVRGRYQAEFEEKEGHIFVRAWAPGFGAAVSPDTALESGRATYEADVVLRRAADLEGRVVSAERLRPVAGARVALRRASGETETTSGSVAAVSDSDGRFRIPDVAAGDACLEVAADGFVNSVTSIRAPSAGDFVVTLEPSFEIAGKVTLPNGAVASDVWDGSAVSGIWVSARMERDPEHRISGSAATDADGRFRVTGLARGTYTVRVHVWNSAISVASFETTGVPSGTTDLVIALLPAAEIAGRVLAPDGRPLGGCTVVAYSESGDPYTPSATTKDDGSFVVRGIGAGTYRLEVRPPEAERSGYVTLGAQLRAAKAAGVPSGATGVEIRLTGGLSIRGVLFDAAGKPLANAWVRAEARSGQDLGPEEAAWFLGPGAQTDSAGRFTITGLATARYRIVHVPDPQRFDLARPLKGGDDVEAGAAGVRLVAGRATRIAGVVLDEEGSAVARATVTARPVGGGPAVLGQTREDGTFSLDGVSDLARCVLSVSAADFIEAQVDDVAPGATDVRVRLARGLRASGRILGLDGAPFANAVVTLTLEGGEHRVTVVADAHGRFVATALREGTYRVEARSSTSPGSMAGPRSCGTLRAGDVKLDLRMTP